MIYPYTHIHAYDVYIYLLFLENRRRNGKIEKQDDTYNNNNNATGSHPRYKNTELFIYDMI